MQACEALKVSVSREPQVTRPALYYAQVLPLRSVKAVDVDGHFVNMSSHVVVILAITGQKVPAPDDGLTAPPTYMCLSI